MSELAFVPYFKEQVLFPREPLNKFTVNIKLDRVSTGIELEKMLPQIQKDVFGDIEIDYDNVIMYYGKSDGLRYVERDIEILRNEIVRIIMQEESEEKLA